MRFSVFVDFSVLIMMIWKGLSRNNELSVTFSGCAFSFVTKNKRNPLNQTFWKCFCFSRRNNNFWGEKFWKVIRVGNSGQVGEVEERSMGQMSPASVPPPSSPQTPTQPFWNPKWWIFLYNYPKIDSNIVFHTRFWARIAFLVPKTFVALNLKIMI